MESDNLQDKLAQARLSLTDDQKKAEWKQKLDDLEKKKKEARIAMENAAQREKREKEEEAARNEIQTKTKLIEDLARQKKEEEARKIEAEKEAELAAQKKETDRLQRIESMLEAKKEAETIKREPVVEINPLETLKTDISKTIREDNLSAARIAIKEREKSPFIPDDTPLLYRRKNLIILVLIFTLLAGASGLAWWFWQKNQTQNELAALTTFKHTPLIFADQEIEINLTGKTPAQIMSVIGQTLAQWPTNIPAGKDYIKEIYFTMSSSTVFNGQTVKLKEETSFNQWLASTTIALPDDFSRFVSAPFTIGAYRGTAQGVFLILKTQDYSHLADALLREEDQIIPALLGPFLSLTDKTQLNQINFQDKIFQNLDTRVAKDSNNNTLAIYSFLDPQTLVITQSEEILSKIIETYNTQRAR